MRIATACLALVLTVSGAAFAETHAGVPEDRETQPIAPPTPSFPVLAAYMKVSGRCDVHFNVDAGGRTKDIQPLCTHRVFCKSARDAVGSVTFEPKMEGGRKVERRNVVYPLWYTVDNGMDPDSVNAWLAAKELIACSGYPVS